MLDSAPLQIEQLEALSRQVARDLSMMSFATKPWVFPVEHEGEIIPDVVIIGAGQSGLAAGFELKRRGVSNVVLLDANREGFEGSWETYARNYEIRSPKTISGLEGGIPALSIEAYVRAAYGDARWEAMVRVPRKIWMNYLRWFRAMVQLDIRNETKVLDIAYDAQGVTLTLHNRPPMRARLVVLATGMDGGGAWSVPAEVSDNLPRHCWNHSADIFDESQLAGKRVGVIGAGAAAFDMAVTALDAGAKSVDLLLRRKALPMRDVVRELETGGYLVHAYQLPDQVKWDIANYMSVLSQAPAEHHFHKACSFDNFNISLGSGIVSLRYEEGEIHFETPRKVWHFDHLFAATGVGVNMAARPELARIVEKAALWRHRFTPADGQANERRMNFPYLDSHYRFQPLIEGDAPGLERIFAFNTLAAMSVGAMAAVQIGSYRFGTARLVDGLTEHLFLEQATRIVPHLDSFDKPGTTIPANMQVKLAREMELLAEEGDLI